MHSSPQPGGGQRPFGGDEQRVGVLDRVAQDVREDIAERREHRADRLQIDFVPLQPLNEDPPLGEPVARYGPFVITMVPA